MKVLLLFFALFCAAEARATCVGGFDGMEANIYGCSELRALGDLTYERNADGTVVKKRSDAEIKQYVVDFVKDRFKNRGVKLEEKDVKVGAQTVSFDLFNQNGDKIFSYTLDKTTGVPENETALEESRKAVDAKRTATRRSRLSEIERLKKYQAELENGGERK